MNKKIAIIADTHFGARGNSPYFLNKQKKFFKEIFFPYIDSHQIQTIIHLGDVFDKRSNLNYTMYDESLKFFFDEIISRNIEMHTLIGNHDCPFRNTNYPNSPELLLKNKNFKIYTEPKEITIMGQKMTMIPWINVENVKETHEVIENSSSRYLMGHLEINGFQMVKGFLCEKGLDRKTLSKFDKVFSGHFHIRSQGDNIWYVGNPYETDWSDHENMKGFHILDLDDHSLIFIENPETTHIIIRDFKEVTEDNVSSKIVKIDLTNMLDDEIEKVYKTVDNLPKKPENILYINKTNFTENADVKDVDLGIKTTKQIIIEYIESMETDEKKHDELKLLMSNLYERAVEV